MLWHVRILTFFEKEIHSQTKLHMTAKCKDQKTFNEGFIYKKIQHRDQNKILFKGPKYTLVKYLLWACKVQGY